MGWLSFSMHRPVKEWFKSELNSEYELLDAALVQRRTFYAAIKNKATGKVFCAVYLIRWAPRSYYNFSYKGMDEFCGPVEANCPLRIIKLLSPLNDEDDPNGWARAWREKVAKYWATRNTINSGGIIKTEKPVSFTGGSEYQYFKKIGRTTWAGMMIEDEFRLLCRVRVNLAHYNFEKITEKSLAVS
jgi:hypothetical protein